MSNVGTIDRIIRAIVGLALIIAPLTADLPVLVQLPSVVVGIVLIATAALGFCPIYALIGLASKQRRQGRA